MTIAPEHTIRNQRRLDIAIEIPLFGIIAIENKPWANDQEAQLEDYADYLSEVYKNRDWILIYLCNNTPPTHSISASKAATFKKSENLKYINFHELLEWLRISLEATTPLNIKYFLSEFSYLISELVNGDYLMEDDFEYLISQNDSYISAAFAISKSTENMKNKLMAKLRDDLSAALMDSSPGFSLDFGFDFDNSMRNFSICFPGAKNFHLTFEFGREKCQDLYWGIKFVNLERETTHKRDAIKRAMDNNSGIASSSDYFPWYRYVDSKIHRNWDDIPEPWLAIKNGSMAKQVIEIKKEVYNVLKSADLLED